MSSLAVCRELAAQDTRVRLFQHPGGANRGAGPSRTLGMAHSRCPYLAFLDADDLYLPGRFDPAERVFETDPACDGVYDAVGIHFEDESARQRWLSSGMAGIRLTTLEREVAPEDLFRVLMKGGAGHIHLDGLVLRRELVTRTGPMDETIADTLHEDTDYILRLAALGRLLAGSRLEPTSLRRVHAANRVSAPRGEREIYRDHMRQQTATWNWCRSRGLKDHARLAFKRMIDECLHNKPVGRNRGSVQLLKLKRIIAWSAEMPGVLLQREYWAELVDAKLNWLKSWGKQDG